MEINVKSIDTNTVVIPVFGAMTGIGISLMKGVGGESILEKQYSPQKVGTGPTF